jgi:hypothetical protein
VPYRIQQQQGSNSDPPSSFLFTLTLKAAGLLHPFNSQSTQTSSSNWQADVELFSQAREQQFVRTLLLNSLVDLDMGFSKSIYKTCIS